MDHDARPRPRLRRGLVRLRRAPARHGRHGQRDRDRPRRAGRDRGDRAGLLRRVLADPLDLPRRPAAGRPPRVADQRATRSASGRGSLDIVQGTGPERPSAVRNLSVGTGSLRIVRAELPVDGPRMRASLTLENSILTGTFENASDKDLENVAVVLGSSSSCSATSRPGATVNVRLPVRDNPFGASLADQIVGASFDTATEEGVRRSTRYAMVQQLTYDPMGMVRRLAARRPRGDPRVRPRRDPRPPGSATSRPAATATSCTTCRSASAIEGQVTFSSDLLRSYGDRQRCAVLPEGPAVPEHGRRHGDDVLPADPVRGDVHRRPRSGSRSGRAAAACPPAGEGISRSPRSPRRAPTSPTRCRGLHAAAR